MPAIGDRGRGIDASASASGLAGARDSSRPFVGDPLTHRRGRAQSAVRQGVTARSLRRRLVDGPTHRSDAPRSDRASGRLKIRHPVDDPARGPRSSCAARRVGSTSRRSSERRPFRVHESATTTGPPTARPARANVPSRASGRADARLGSGPRSSTRRERCVDRELAALAEAAGGTIHLASCGTKATALSSRRRAHRDRAPGGAPGGSIHLKQAAKPNWSKLRRSSN